MNQRAKELAIEAGLYVDLKGEPWPKWLGAEECEQAYARFAELLVKECADYVDSAISDGGVDGRSLKEHFGVEE
jgi:hypothetical protein